MVGISLNDAKKLMTRWQKRDEKTHIESKIELTLNAV